MAKQTPARIIGTGSYLPTRILSNDDLEQLVQTSDEWIFSRTGIKERRIANTDEFSSDMGAIAAQRALESAKITAQEIDFILVATMTPDHLCPSTAALIQNKIEAPQAATLDIQAACTGFLYGLSIAKAYIESGMYKNILLIASEKMSSFMDYQDRTTCVLFGDGAAAAVISSKKPGLTIESIFLGADGSQSDLMKIPAGGSSTPASADTIEQRLHYFNMDGRETYKHAIKRMTASTRDCLHRSGVQEQEITWLIPHQANIRIIDAIAKNFDIPSEKVYKTVHKYGNTSASSIAIALDELLREHPLKKGDSILLTAFGAGLTWGSSLLKWETDNEE
jgi:3-oxoacyl-[acyl-carrier-protein] synthase III